MKLSPGGVARSEPALVTMAAVWLLTQAGALVVTREHWLGAQTWDSVTQAAVPIVSALILGVAGWLLRRVVTPAWKWIEHELPGVAAELPDVASVLAEAEAIFPTPTQPAAASEEN